MIIPVADTFATRQPRASVGHTRASSFILHERASSYFWREPGGWLSVKSTLAGEVQYTADGARFLVDESGYLVLNAGRPYVVAIEAHQPVESFCVFLGQDLVADVLQALTAPAEDLAAGEGRAPARRCPDPQPFVERVYPHDALVTPALRALRAALELGPGGAGALTEGLHLLADGLLCLHREVQREMRRLPQVRASTRAELYRRLHHARDFIDSSMCEPVSLAATASVARLSPCHCLRLFKQAFGETPHQYMTRRRLERAQKLLLQSSRSVTDICFALGFESLGSFSWLFRRRLGASPQEFRKRAARAHLSEGEFERRFTRSKKHSERRVPTIGTTSDSSIVCI